jgi:predicted aldo/keto reductase-like oxidoreductase|tara:strand:+ start:240 stop:491 length:252 start_codon:yes stop_codon:yes gene_type:complete
MKKIEEIKNKLNISSNKIKNFSLDFIMANKMVSTILVGCSSFKQLKEIVKYNKQKKVFSQDIYKKSFKILKNISKKYKIPNQL